MYIPLLMFVNPVRSGLFVAAVRGQNLGPQLALLLGSFLLPFLILPVEPAIIGRVIVNAQDNLIIVGRYVIGSVGIFFILDLVTIATSYLFIKAYPRRAEKRRRRLRLLRMLRYAVYAACVWFFLAECLKEALLNSLSSNGNVIIPPLSYCIPYLVGAVGLYPAVALCSSHTPYLNERNKSADLYRVIPVILLVCVTGVAISFWMYAAKFQDLKGRFRQENDFNRTSGEVLRLRCVSYVDRLLVNFAVRAPASDDIFVRVSDFKISINKTAELGFEIHHEDNSEVLTKIDKGKALPFVTSLPLTPDDQSRVQHADKCAISLSYESRPTFTLRGTANIIHETPH